MILIVSNTICNNDRSLKIRRSPHFYASVIFDTIKHTSSKDTFISIQNNYIRERNTVHKFKWNERLRQRSEAVKDCIP